MHLELTAQELTYVVDFVSRTGCFYSEPKVVEDFHKGLLTPNVLTFLVPWMWRHKLDHSPVRRDTWRAMFEHAHYTEDKIARPRPRETKSTLAYRGATDENRDGIAWTLDPGHAKHFTRSRQAPGVTTARVWAAWIPGDRVHARYLADIEQELTADVRGLEIRPIEEGHLLRKPPIWKRSRR